MKKLGLNVLLASVINFLAVIPWPKANLLWQLIFPSLQGFGQHRFYLLHLIPTNPQLPGNIFNKCSLSGIILSLNEKTCIYSTRNISHDIRVGIYMLVCLYLVSPSDTASVTMSVTTGNPSFCKHSSSRRASANTRGSSQQSSSIMAVMDSAAWWDRPRCFTISSKVFVLNELQIYTFNYIPMKLVHACTSVTSK